MSLTLALWLALVAPAQATDVGAGLTMAGVRSSNGHRPLHRGMAAWGRFPTERIFDLEAELVWVTAKEDFLDERIRTHLFRPSLGLSWSTGTRRAQVSAGVGLCLNLYTGGLDSLVVQLRPGLRARIGVDVPVRGNWQLRWHYGMTTRGFSADVETGLGLGRVL